MPKTNNRMTYDAMTYNPMKNHQKVSSMTLNDILSVSSTVID